jgi:hypothetical protein
MKLQIPSSNIQRSIKLQTSNPTTGFVLVLSVWSFSGAWRLVLGAFSETNL